MKEKGIRMAMLISGRGSAAEAVIRGCQNKEITGILPVAVISSRPEAVGLRKARELSVATYVVARKDCATYEEFGDRLLGLLKKLEVDLVSQNGWLPLTPANVVAEYRGKIINQHPGPLDPGGGIDFGGKGMYGIRVIGARLAFCWLTGEDNWTEATSHQVAEQYDQGGLIRVVRLALPEFPARVTVAEIIDQPRELLECANLVAEQLLPLEHENVKSVLKMFARGEDISGYRREEPLVAKESEPAVRQAKELAIKLFP